ncbi:50S ribosome-binding GTPase [Dactylosporangium sp. NBC_01737]|uniref:GTPase family protein n=1 Tax=Dactylosporangium sp. NBC_01737 TaxID=2975959 RepID=UPI002E154DBD|nr:50S ribosome-binding GTPase [Dactylosporangium sp. NBC_01737]
MSLVDRIKQAIPRQGGAVDADRLAERVEGLRRFVQATEDHVPDARLVTARTVIDRAGERLALSRAHTVVALAGATGSGKSSLFNALCRFQLSRVGVRRPTTGVAHACVWGPQGAGPLLDWLGVPPNRRFTRESALDGDDEAGLRGLVLLDLPDFDSIEARHRLEVDRLLRLVDLVVWVLDPQKYADRVVHQQYLAQFQRHRDVTVVVLNQADRLNRADSERLVADLRRLLEADGLGGVPAFATSAKGQPGLDTLRATLERTVEQRQAALQRLAGDVRGAVGELGPLVAVDSGGEKIQPAAVRRLADSLAVAAGVPIVVTATERTYRHRATGVLGWPVARWARKLRPDPLRRLHLDQPAGGTPAASSLPESTAAQKAAVTLASREVAEQAGAGLPEPWPAAVTAASRSRLDDVPDAMDVAVAAADLGMSRRPLWWRLVGALQWLGAAAALVGLLWLAVRAVFSFLGLPDVGAPQVGRLPLPTALLLGGLLFGVLLSIVVRPIVGLAARRAKARAERRLRAAIAEVADVHVVAPMRSVLRSYDDAREALRTAAR